MAHIRTYSLLPIWYFDYQLYHNVSTSFFSGNWTPWMLLEYSKVLAAILYYIGISQNARCIIKDEFWNRKQLVQAKKNVSVIGEAFCSIPQGSMQWPIFFCIYSVDIVRDIHNGPTYLYANDKHLLYWFNSFDTQQANISII